MIALLIQLAVLSPRRMPMWSPVLYVLGVATIAINLDLLPLGAVFFGLALAPGSPLGSMVGRRHGVAKGLQE